MKRIGYLWEKVIDIDNIKVAIINASKGKRDRATVKRCLADLDGTAANVRALLLNGFSPSEPTVRKIKDQVHHKERAIACPQFYPDQIVHHALMQAIIPVLEHGMYYHSYGSIKDKGSHKAVHQLERWVRRGRRMRYALQIDVRKFYQHCSPSVVEEALRKRIKDERIIELVMVIVNRYEDGLPLGYYTSQWFGNLVLTDLDHKIKASGVEFYIRYMDDMTCLSKSKKRLHGLLAKIVSCLSKMGMSLKQNWQIFKIGSRPIEFLGYRITKSKTMIRRSTFLRIRRRFSRVAKKRTLALRDARALISYYGVLCHADVKYFEESLPVKKCELRRVITGVCVQYC